MVAPKGKLNAVLSQVVGDNGVRKSVGRRSVKVYTDNEEAKGLRNNSIGANTTKTKGTVVPLRMKSAPDKGGGGIRLNAKGNLKTLRESKVLHGTSGKPNSARCALSDISNVQSQQSKNEVIGRLKSVKDKTERSVSLHRVPICSSTRKVIASSKKPPMLQVSKNTAQSVEVLPASKRDIKDVKVSPNGQKMKGQVRESFGNGSRISERKPPLPTRKSLPVWKNANQLDRSHDKVPKNAETSETNQGKYGFPVKTKVGTKVTSQVSTARSHLWRNRVSDGFVIMNTRGQVKSGVQTLSRNTTRPVVKSTCPTANAQKGSKIQGTSTLNRGKSGVSVSSMNKSGVVASSIFKRNSSLVSHKHTQEAVKSDCNDLSRNTSVVNATKKSVHRRSYTSLLMDRSKLLEEHGEIKNKKLLPIIDDKCNQLEVSEYVDDIYQYYWVSEEKSQSLGGYMKIQTEVTPQIRDILINWLIEVHFKFDLMQETLYLTVSLLDQYLSLVTIKKNEMQLVGLTALLLASKYEDFWHPRVKDLISISVESYTGGQMLGMEKLILKKLNFRLNVPTLYVFMLRFLKAAQSDTKLEHLAFYLIELCLVQYGALKFKPSMLCASAIYVARCTLQMSPPWTPLLHKHARYEESQIRECAEMILSIQKTAKTSKLNVTFEKFLKPDLGCVAAIKPLAKLPNL